MVGENQQYRMKLNDQYRRKLLEWYDNASVRSAWHVTLRETDLDQNLFFSPELVAVSQHPLVQRRGKQVVDYILLQHFYSHLRFTKHLEHKIVNKVTRWIADGNLGIKLPQNMRAYADAIYTDEAYHAQFCSDARRQIRTVTGVAPARTTRPQFLHRLRVIRESLAVDHRRLCDVCFAVVSETLISSTLTQVPRDIRVLPFVRKTLAHHAHDEGRHHAFFADFFTLMWPRLTSKEQYIIGPLFPRFIRTFLDPDRNTIAAFLTDGVCAFARQQAEQIICESFPQVTLNAVSRNAAAATINLCRRNRLLDHAQTADAFSANGLIE